MKILQKNAAVKIILGFSLLVITLGGNAWASSFTFDALNESQTFTIGPWTSTNDGQAIAGTLEGTITFELTSFAATTTAPGLPTGNYEVATFAVTIANVGTDPNARIVGAGFDVLNPDGVAAATNSGTWSASLNDNFGAGFGTVDLCVWSGSNCTGGGSGGLGPLASTTFNVMVYYADGTSLTNGLTYSTPFMRWQSVTALNPGTDCEEGESNPCLSAKLGEVPEPSAILLFGSGLLGLGVWRWKKMQK